MILLVPSTALLCILSTQSSPFSWVMPSAFAIRSVRPGVTSPHAPRYRHHNDCAFLPSLIEDDNVRLVMSNDGFDLNGLSPEQPNPSVLHNRIYFL